MIRNVLKFVLGLLAYLPTLAVFAGIGYLAYEGHRRDWHWSEKKEPKQEKKAAEAGDDGDANQPPLETDGNYGASPFDSTLTITHNPDTCPLEKRDITFKDDDIGRKSGIYLGTVRERELEQVLTVTGTVEFDPTRIARVSPCAGGTIWRIDKQVGDEVEPGELLAIIDAAEVGKAKAAFYQAKVQLDLKRQLHTLLQTGGSPERTLIEAEAALRDTRVQLATTYQALLNLGLRFKLTDVEKDGDDELARRLHFLGVPEISAGLTSDTTNNLLPMRNPLTDKGVILQRFGVKGETVAALQPIFVVGDTNRMMLMLDVRQEDRLRVAVKQPVRFVSDGDKDEVTGVIDWIDPEIDPKTRTAKARVFVDNPQGRLKAKSFGSAQITIRPKQMVLTIPEEAIQWEGCSHIVFVKEKANQFEVRKVRLGIRRDGFVEVQPGFKEMLYLDPLHLISEDGCIEVSCGVRAGEQIAVLGSHVLKSHLFKDRLGTAEE